MCATDGAIGALIFDFNAIDKQLVAAVVAFDQGRTIHAHELAEGFIQGGDGQRRVEARQTLAQAVTQHRLAVVIAFGVRRAGGYVGAVQHGIAKLTQPL